MKKLIVISLLSIFAFSACKKDTKTTTVNTPPAAARLVFKFKFDSTQARLDGLGNPVSVPAGHQAQSPRFNGMSGHYIEMAQSDMTGLGAGAVLYKAAEVSSTGTYTTAIDFD